MSWNFKKLAEVCELNIGKTPSRSDKSYWVNDTHEGEVWLSIADLTKCSGLEIFDSKEKITSKGASLFRSVNAGTLMMSFKLSIGKLAIAGRNLYTNEAIVALPIKNKNELNIKFLFYFLSFYDWDKESENDVKVKGKTLNKAKLKEILVPIPSLATQQKIVSKLDTIFAEIDRAVLATETNIKNVEALWQSTIDRVITDFKHLKKSSFFSESVLINSKLIDPKEEQFHNFIHIGAANIISNSDELCDLKTAKEEGLISGKFIFDENTVLYSKIRPYLKKVAKPSFIGLCSADVYPLVCNEKLMVKDFLFYVLLSSDFTKFAISGSDRAGMPKVNREHLFSYKLNLPDISSQEKLASQINKIQKEVKSSIVILGKKLENLNSLKEAILRQAFNGDLIKD